MRINNNVFAETVVASLVGRGSALALGKASVAEPLVIQAAHGQIDGSSRHPARLIGGPGARWLAAYVRQWLE